MGGVIMPLDEALELVANEGIFRVWTRDGKCMRSSSGKMVKRG